MTTTAVGRMRSAAVVVLVLGLAASPAGAHPGEGETPYRYVSAPPGVTSEGPPEVGISTQPIGPAVFAGTTDNQMQLTLPEGAFPAAQGETGVRVQLDQLDPATLPPLPAGLEPEGNGYRVGLTYALSGGALTALALPATLGVVAPAAPTDVLELVDGQWVRLSYTPVAEEAGFSSVVQVDGPITLMQVYDPARAPRPTAAVTARPTPPAPVEAASTDVQDEPRPVLPLVLTGLLLAALAGGLLEARRRRRGSRP